MDGDRIFSIIESVLFAAGEPMKIKDIASIVEMNEKEVLEILNMMDKNYKESSRGIMLLNLNGAYCLSTKSENSKYVQRLLKIDSKRSLSQAALETLAIIVYKGPVTRLEIDDIRGVRSERAVETLLEKNIIKEAGRKDSPGRPILFTITDEFFKIFNLNSLENMPNLDLININYNDE
ncbi:MAG: SMC-Scp complex subunit ScpB [Oscillospiraceae bacterium]|nr:SMC-Scp complex subunit ScpB [Oscillospiraceae bacterium]